MKNRKRNDSWKDFKDNKRSRTPSTAHVFYDEYLSWLPKGILEQCAAEVRLYEQ